MLSLITKTVIEPEIRSTLSKTIKGGIRQEIVFLITKMVIEPEIRLVIINLVEAGDQIRNGPLDYQIGKWVRNEVCGYKLGKCWRPDPEIVFLIT